MAKGQGKTGLIVTIVALGLTLVIVATIVILQNLNRPAVTNDASTTDTTKTEETTTDDATDETPKTDTPATTVDPATLKSIDIEPLAITIFYSKGIPGFDFAVKRAADRTQYVEFSSPDLAGTKCTNDEGVFASILKNSTTAEADSSATTKKKIGNDTYELSLAGPDCTSNVTLLKEYQTAFSNGFSELKVME